MNEMEPGAQNRKDEAKMPMARLLLGLLLCSLAWSLWFIIVMTNTMPEESCYTAVERNATSSTPFEICVWHEVDCSPLAEDTGALQCEDSDMEYVPGVLSWSAENDNCCDPVLCAELDCCDDSPCSHATTARSKMERAVDLGSLITDDCRSLLLCYLRFHLDCPAYGSHYDWCVGQCAPSESDPFGTCCGGPEQGWGAICAEKNDARFACQDNPLAQIEFDWCD